MGVGKAFDVAIGEESFGYACFTSAATTNYDADLPSVILNGNLSGEVFLHLAINECKAADD